ncbi:MAG TPA: hypothetical protein VGY97_08590 [Solirubrobacteraceae bacterium]|nr:hypothetical protein [Solirubrobacteraceae bacterium]
MPPLVGIVGLTLGVGSAPAAPSSAPPGAARSTSPAAPRSTPPRAAASPPANPAQKTKRKKAKPKPPKVPQPTIVPPVVLDGPSPDIQSLGGVAIAVDGGGALVYVKAVNGVNHVFASLLTSHVWSPPVQVDVGLSGASSQPVVGAGNLGKVAVAFINGGNLYQSVAPGTGQHFTPPQGIATSASNPALSMSQDGAAYLSFTDPTTPAHVRVAHMPYKDINFHLNPQSLNIDAARNAGDTPAKAPRVGISADGTGIVSWGEDGADGHVHAWVRRVARDSISPTPQDIGLPSFGGATGIGADAAQVQLEFAGSLGWGVFRQAFSATGTPERVFARRFIGSLFESPVPLDDLTFPATDSAGPPALSSTGKGDALVAVGLLSSHQTIASVARAKFHRFEAPIPLNSGTDAVDPQPAAALGNNGVGLVAWHQSSAAGAPIGVMGRSLAGFHFGPEVRLSSPSLGSVAITGGFYAAADRHGNATVAYVQGDAAGRRIVVAGQRAHG